MNPALSTSALDLEKFNAAPLNTDPYDFLVLPEFIRSEYLDSIRYDFPRINQAGSFPAVDLKYGPAFAALLQELEGPAFGEAMARKFGVDLTGRPTMITVRGHTDATDGRIHTDSKTKIITVLIYLNDKWQDSGGRLRILRSGTDLQDYAAEVDPAMGTLLAFRRSDCSWHGHLPFVGERRAIQLNWVLDEGVKRREQKRHGISAFFKRLLGKNSYQG